MAMNSEYPPLSKWLTNPGDDEKTPHGALDGNDIVRIRFFGVSHESHASFDDEGPVNEWYWLHEEDEADIIEYQVIRRIGEKTLSPAEVVNKIHAMMDGEFWEVDMLTDIAEWVKAAGYEIRDPADMPDDEEE